LPVHLASGTISLLDAPAPASKQKWYKYHSSYLI
jgi:hypothetical protein